MFKYFLIIQLFFILILGSCDPFNTGFNSTEPAKNYKADNLTDYNSKNDILVMTWNIKFGGGRLDFFFDCYGNRSIMTKTEVMNNLEALASKINQVNPDILLLQEVDVLSKRSAYINQIQYLLNHTNLNYGTYASQWKADFVLSDGIGKVDSGNAILSKWEITESTRISLPLISEQDSLTQYFYLKRNILKAKIVMDSTEFYVLNIHTSAYSNDGTKKKQLDRFKTELDLINNSGEIFIAGGDLNTIPPGSDKLSDFPDSVCEDEEFQADNFTEEQTWLNDFYSDYTPAISLTDFANDNSLYFGHTTNKDGFWNRKLDYLFTNRIFSGGIVHQNTTSGGMETMPLSDHAPLIATFSVN
jgi:endonuclease/exonuclease/phosphatase family metal-dependent hydrolase